MSIPTPPKSAETVLVSSSSVPLRYIVPSTAYAGGLPDIMCYMLAKEAREKYDEDVKEFHGYVSMCYARAEIYPRRGSGGAATR